MAPQSSWRRGLLVGAIILCGFCALCVIGGRPGDLETGLIGGVVGGFFGLLGCWPDILAWLRKGKQ